MQDNHNCFPAVRADFDLQMLAGSAPKFYGIRGATLRQFHQEGHIMQKIIGHHPTIVVIHLGGNDLDNPTVKPAAVGMSLFELAKFISVNSGATVVLSQVLFRERWRNHSSSQGNARVKTLNEFLSAVCQDCDGIKFWCHRNLWKSKQNLYRSDGVHLSPLGNYKFYRSIRGAITHYTYKAEGV